MPETTKKMPAKKLKNYKKSEKQQKVVKKINRNEKRQFGTYTYQPEYPEIIFNLLSKSRDAKTKSHCCHALQCSRPTFDKWLKEFPELREAFDLGMEYSQKNWRDKLAKFAFLPASEVNNGLIKMLSANVYGIKDESMTNVAINTPEPIKFRVEFFDATADHTGTKKT